ncbi:unnamed protein product [Penicillium camemberti]|uniref:Str. FM013 n=1 Tax=Penicillium camemberti (strain FM 013) TaxID=1429867 RepID=A0A0G4PV23_PENC3|nr:unnamed protein product [Penicillium camemberti]
MEDSGRGPILDIVAECHEYRVRAILNCCIKALPRWDLP